MDVEDRGIFGVRCWMCMELEPAGMQAKSSDSTKFVADDKHEPSLREAVHLGEQRFDHRGSTPEPWYAWRGGGKRVEPGTT